MVVGSALASAVKVSCMLTLVKVPLMVECAPKGSGGDSSVKVLPQTKNSFVVGSCRESKNGNICTDKW